jgi:hypothetical protein
VPAPSVSILSWLRPEQIHVAFAQTQWRLQAHSAADWLGAIACDFDALSGVFPGLICDEELDAMQQLLRDPSQFDLMPDVARQVVQAAGGRDWWWSVNLTRRAMAGWIYINGVLVRQGVRADSTSFPDWMDACYSWMYERSDENGRAALDIELGLPPKGVRQGSKQTKQMLAAFQAD